METASSSQSIQWRLKRRTKLSFAVRSTAKGGSGSGGEVPNEVLANDSLSGGEIGREHLRILHLILDFSSIHEQENNAKLKQDTCIQ